MPKLYAYNTSATEIKKRYAMIGSTATLIKKKYAMIGSTATLVYSTGYSLIDNFSSYTTYNYDLINPPVNGFSMKKSGNTIVYTSGQGIQAVVLKPAFDLSKYSSMRITVSAQTLSTSKGIRVRFGTTDDKYYSVDIYNTGTYTINLSSVTATEAYFMILPINDTAATGTVTFSELTLE